MPKSGDQRWNRKRMMKARAERMNEAKQRRMSGETSVGEKETEETSGVPSVTGEASKGQGGMGEINCVTGEANEVQGVTGETSEGRRARGNG